MVIRVMRLVFLAVLLVLLGLPALSSADEPNQAGLVVQFGDGRVETRCIAFDGAEISGSELLTLSGVHAVIDASRGMGITVCQIEGEGCAYPSEPCFCQCMGGGDCGYWNYFYRDPGQEEWTYSALGAVLRKAQPGSVEAWVWGDGHVPPASDLTFEIICVPPTPVSTPTSAPTRDAQETPLATVTPHLTPPVSPSPVATAMPSATVTESVTAPVPTAGVAQSLSSYWPFGLVVLTLAAVGAVVWRRRA
jgi:hypothetical protein